MPKKHIKTGKGTLYICRRVLSEHGIFHGTCLLIMNPSRSNLTGLRSRCLIMDIYQYIRIDMIII